MDHPKLGMEFGVVDGVGKDLAPVDRLPQAPMAVPGIPGHLDGRPPAPAAPMFNLYIPSA